MPSSNVQRSGRPPALAVVLGAPRGGTSDAAAILARTGLVDPTGRCVAATAVGGERGGAAGSGD
ncbi:MAG: hypothetical protein ACYCTE_13335, partial [Acidimicrobiales bacterium]